MREFINNWRRQFGPDTIQPAVSPNPLAGMMSPSDVRAHRWWRRGSLRRPRASMMAAWLPPTSARIDDGGVALSDVRAQATSARSSTPSTISLSFAANSAIVSYAFGSVHDTAGKHSTTRHDIVRHDISCQRWCDASAKLDYISRRHVVYL